LEGFVKKSGGSSVSDNTSLSRTEDSIFNINVIITVLEGKLRLSFLVHSFFLSFFRQIKKIETRKIPLTLSYFHVKQHHHHHQRDRGTTTHSNRSSPIEEMMVGGGGDGTSHPNSPSTPSSSSNNNSGNKRRRRQESSDEDTGQMFRASWGHMNYHNNDNSKEEDEEEEEDDVGYPIFLDGIPSNAILVLSIVKHEKMKVNLLGQISYNLKENWISKEQNNHNQTTVKKLFHPFQYPIIDNSSSTNMRFDLNQYTISHPKFSSHLTFSLQMHYNFSSYCSFLMGPNLDKCDNKNVVHSKKKSKSKKKTKKRSNSPKRRRRKRKDHQRSQGKKEKNDGMMELEDYEESLINEVNEKNPKLKKLWVVIHERKLMIFTRYGEGCRLMIDLNLISDLRFYTHTSSNDPSPYDFSLITHNDLIYSFSCCSSHDIMRWKLALNLNFSNFLNSQKGNLPSYLYYHEKWLAQRAKEIGEEEKGNEKKSSTVSPSKTFISKQSRMFRELQHNESEGQKLEAERVDRELARKDYLHLITQIIRSSNHHI